MGVCALGNAYQTSNHAENIIVSSIYNFINILDYSKIDFLDEFQKIKTIQYEKKDENLVEEKETFLSIKYKEFMKNFIDYSNPYCSFHEYLFPSFDSLFDSYLQDSPEYNLLLFALPYLREKNKMKIIIEILNDNRIKPTLNELLNFLERMYNETIIVSTEKLVKYILKIKNNTEMLDTEYVVDMEMKDQAMKALEFYKKYNYFPIIKKEIMKIVEEFCESKKHLT